MIVGDGAVNTGQFHETLNMAAIWSLPLVVVVENNHYAISVPADDVILRSPGTLRRPRAMDLGTSVDGTDVEAVAVAFEEAADHARSGGGPALLEATCYRFRGHYEGDVDDRTQREKDHMAAEGDNRSCRPPPFSPRSRASRPPRSRRSRSRSVEDRGNLLERVREMPIPDRENALTDVFADVGR